jgi:hypothetical protein
MTRAKWPGGGSMAQGIECCFANTKLQVQTSQSHQNNNNNNNNIKALSRENH